MTEQERTARLEGIVETWNRVLEQQDRRFNAEMIELRRSHESLTGRMDRLDGRMDQLVSDMGALRADVSHLRGWLIGAVAVMAVFTALNALVG